MRCAYLSQVYLVQKYNIGGSVPTVGISDSAIAVFIDLTGTMVHLSELNAHIERETRSYLPQFHP